MTSVRTQYCDARLQERALVAQLVVEGEHQARLGRDGGHEALLRIEKVGLAAQLFGAFRYSINVMEEQSPASPAPGSFAVRA